MLPSNDEADLRRRLAEVEERVRLASEILSQWQGRRDALLAELLDVTGADSSRYVAVR